MYTPTLTTHELPEHDEMERLLDAHDVDAYFEAFERFDAHVSAIADEMIDAADAYGCIFINVYAKSRREYRLYLHRSARYVGHLQLTAWDCDGPIWDVKVSDADALVRDLYGLVRSKVSFMYYAA